MNDLLTPAEVEDRLRRTLAVRAGDVPPSDALGGDGDLDAGPGADLGAASALVLVGDGHRAASTVRRRRRRTVLAAAAACVVVAGGVAALGAGRHPTATVGPAQEGQDDQATTTAPPATLDAERQRALAEMQARLAEARAEARRVWEDHLVPAEGEMAERIKELEDEAARQGRMPRAVAGYKQVGQPLGQEIWLYLTWYPSPLVGQEPDPGMVGEDVAVAETRARLDTSQIDQAVNVWLLYEDGALGIHGGGLTRDEMLGVAASVHRTPGTDEFASTPPPGWEVDPDPLTGG